MRYLITVVHEGPEPKDVPAELYEAMGPSSRSSMPTASSSTPADWRRSRRRPASTCEAVEYAKQSVELHRTHFPGFEVTHEVRQIMDSED